MSYYDYEISKRVAAEDYPFYALIMAAIRQADTDNLEKLRDAFPQTFAELMYRYNSPGGIHPMDGRAEYDRLTAINAQLLDALKQEETK